MFVFDTDENIEKSKMFKFRFSGEIRILAPNGNFGGKRFRKGGELNQRVRIPCHRPPLLPPQPSSLPSWPQLREQHHRQQLQEQRHLHHHLNKRIIRRISKLKIIYI